MLSVRVGLSLALRSFAALATHAGEARITLNNFKLLAKMPSFLQIGITLAFTGEVIENTKKRCGVTGVPLEPKDDLMKTLLLAGLCCSTMVVASADAKTFVRKADPSGAPMCFTQAGSQTALSNCESVATSYLLSRDPSGAPMCHDQDGRLSDLQQCDDKLAKTIEPRLLDALPDARAAATASKFINAVEADSVRSFTSLLHPRGIHHGGKKIRNRALATVVKTLGVRSFVSMPHHERWNIRASDKWFSVFRGEGNGKTTIAYFELYRGQWRLVQLARVAFAETASR